MEDSNNLNQEKYLEDYPSIISAKKTEIILSQMKKNICKLYMDDGSKGTGFFCKFPFPDKDHLTTFLITNNHLIDEAHLKKDSQIIFTTNNDEIQHKIIIDKRKVYTSKLYDTTIIEIFEEKDNIHDFLELDFDINVENYNNIYIKKSIYILQYPNNEMSSVSYGIIKGIDLLNKYDISHLCCTEKGSSGSPIMNLSSNKLIGIHKGANNNFNFNKGALLLYPIKEFISQIKENKKGSNNSEPFFNFKIKFDFQYNCFGSYYQDKVSKLYMDIKKFAYNKEYQVFGWDKNKLIGIIKGPNSTPYENGFFHFEIKFPKEYYEPPEFLFKTKIFHPNIDETGLVYKEIYDANNYSFGYEINDYIILLKRLLTHPNLNQFIMNEKAARLYKENVNEYLLTVRQYVSSFANFDCANEEFKKIIFNIKTTD